MFFEEGKSNVKGRGNMSGSKRKPQMTKDGEAEQRERMYKNTGRKETKRVHIAQAMDSFKERRLDIAENKNL